MVGNPGTETEKRVSRLPAQRGYGLAWVLLLLALAACSPPSAPTPLPTQTVGPTILPTPIPPPTTVATLVATALPVVSTPTPFATLTATPSSHLFDSVDSQTLFASLFPDLKLTPNGDAFIVNGNPEWLMWIDSRAEGQFTQSSLPELAAIVANEAPQVGEADRQRTAPWGSFLAIFQQQGGKLQAVQRSPLFPTEISPLALEAKIDSVVDYDHDGQNELLIVTTAIRSGISSAAAFLYQWNEQAFVELWSAAVGEDNTAAINQSQYYASSSQFQFSDLNGDGLDEIVVTTTRVEYAQDDQGLADVDRETGRQVERRVFSWSGAAFVPDVALSNLP